MNSYNRLLLHRLAEIFGYHSVKFSSMQVDFKFLFLFLLKFLSHFPLFDSSITGARFLHESVGEGDDRHLILQRCPETSMYVKSEGPSYPLFINHLLDMIFNPFFNF